MLLNTLLIEVSAVRGLRQFFADRGGGISNFVDDSLRFAAGNAKVFDPVFHLRLLIHCNVIAARRGFIRQSSH
jgi:hypothetical protein